MVESRTAPVSQEQGEKRKEQDYGAPGSGSAKEVSKKGLTELWDLAGYLGKGCRSFLL